MNDFNLEFNINSNGEYSLDEIKELDYYKRPELSQSMLKELKKSPAHYKAKYIDKIVPDKDTKSLNFGKLYHCLLLEENRFDDLFAITPEISKISNQYKSWKTEILEKNPNVSFISNKELIHAVSMVNAIKQKHTFNAIKSLPNPVFETPIYFTQEVEIDGVIHKIECKAKPDMYIPPNKVFKYGLCFDNKSSVCAKIDDFSRNTLIKYGLHNQASWYLDAIKSEYSLDNYPEFIFLVQEKEPPFEASFLRCDEYVIDFGRRENQELLTNYMKCNLSNLWTGYPDDIQDLTLPTWAMQQLINEEI